MSRIGKKPIHIPAGVTVEVSDTAIAVKGPKGEVRRALHPDIGLMLKGSEVTVNPRRQGRKISALWGLTRSLVANMIEGAHKGFEKKLEIEGIGYRVNLEGTSLVLRLGFSHPVRVEAPAGIHFAVEKNVVTVSGADKEKVGDTAARIRRLKPPEPYKGKGIRYQGEVIRRKAGKKAVG